MANPVVLIETLEARDALDTALSMITFDVPVQVVLVGQGVLNAFGNHLASKSLAMLEMFDAPTVLVAQQDSAAFNLSDAEIALNPVSDIELQTLLQQASSVSVW
ncbi:hypothetical protein [Salinibius halmophilus]|uniref:hypothetical protein n=1 Tax=Salinibius halmophilus TaxID=1853216 RepID=UPI000E66444B|nr:hypothetical protein [Salinibius halmophilus]